MILWKALDLNFHNLLNSDEDGSAKVLQNVLDSSEDRKYRENRKYFFRSVDFFLKKKLFFENFFYFLKVNRLNFNQLVVRNSRAQYHHFDTWKTEKISPKLQFGIRDSRLKSFLRNFRGTVLIQIQ